MKRRVILAGVFASWMLAGLQAAERPNILFILCDDLGYGDVGVFFQNARRAANDRCEPFHATPNIDAMAAEGIQLRRHYCPAPVCAPSRASLLLGVHQGHANVRDNQFDKALESNHTLATVLKEAGYATAAIGKWGLQGKGSGPADWPAFPTRRGFDYYLGYIRHGDGHEHYPKEGVHRGSKEVYEGPREISQLLDKCYTTDLFTARAKQWIRDQHTAHPDQPFFLYLAYDTPHAVTELPTQAYPEGAGVTGGLQWLGTPGRMINTAGGRVDSWYHPDYAGATWDDDGSAATPETPWPDVYKRYATSVRRIDDCVGDLFQLLKDLKLDDETLVVFTSDNGTSKESYLKQGYDPSFFNSFGPFDGIKRDTWEGGVRVGAIVRWPGNVAGAQTSQLACAFWDWMPTFTELAGLPAPARSDGVSLLPTLTGRGVQAEPLVYIEYFQNGSTPDYAEFLPAHRKRKRGQMQAVYAGAHKGVRYNTGSAQDDFEIYDTLNDPGEANNLARDPEFALLQAQMKARVLQVRRSDDSAARPYDAAAVPALTAVTAVSGELDYAVYEGDWPWVPEFGSISPLREGRTNGFNLAVRPRDEHFGIAFRGFITVPVEGDYTFHLKSDSGAHLRLHEATVIDDDFGRTGQEVSATMRLAVGAHPFRLYYRHGSGPRVLDLEVSGPGLPRGAIAPTMVAAPAPPEASTGWPQAKPGLP